jgi:hypothetical protein
MENEANAPQTSEEAKSSQHSHTHHSGACCAESPTSHLSKDIVMFIQDTSKDPGHLYQYIRDHRGIISANNLEQLSQVIKSAIEEAIMLDPSKTLHQVKYDAEFGESQANNTLFQLARFFFFKFCVMKYCLEQGTEKFFETHLCSDPPDEVVLQFQKDLVLWTPTTFLDKYFPTTSSDGSGSPIV